MVVIIAALLLIQAVSFVGAECRDGWTKFAGSCYLFGLQPSTWAEAEAICLSMNADLTEIESQKESIFLESKLRDIHQHESTNSQKLAASYWIGGNDVETEGIFKWVKSNSPLIYTDWNPGQPDDAGAKEDCMELQGVFNYHWNDLGCTTRHHFICEMSLVAPEIGETIIG